jgi:putative methanogenesis marker protein 6
MGKITRLVVLSSELPSEMHLLIYELHADVTIKETCYGMMIHGEEAMVNALTKTIRKIDPGAFIKERGFVPGDPRRCRADRGGGARPGFYSIQKEYEVLPALARAIAKLPYDTAPAPVEKPEKIPVARLREIINTKTVPAAE